MSSTRPSPAPTSARSQGSATPTTSKSARRTGSSYDHRRILVVDDNPKIHEDFAKILISDQQTALNDAEAALFGSAPPPPLPDGFELHTAQQGELALLQVKEALASGKPYTVAFLDIRMPPGWDGVRTAREIWQVDPRVQIVLCTAYSDYSWADMVAELGARDSFLILKKPFDAIEVRQIAQALSEKWRLLRENEAHLSSLEEQVRVRTVELEQAITRLRREMSDRLLLEKELRHAQKLEALGRLVAGIGHEINNPLAYILSNLEFSRSQLHHLASKSEEERLSAIKEALEEASSGADRIRRIVNSAREFSRPFEATPSAVSIHQCFESARRIVGNELRHRAQLFTALEEAPPVLADPHRLEQVFVNLLMNAAQAMAEGEPKNEIRVTSGRLQQDRVEVTISDTGRGIPESALEHLFEPFFSTRPAGQGTGLGLWICRSIIESFGGTIDITSKPGHGTAVRIALMLAPEMQVEQPARKSSVSPATSRQLRPAKILLVDDEPGVLRGLARALRGHEITMSSNGTEAVELYRSQPYDIVFCDLMMPGFNGMDFYRALEEMGSEHAQKVVMMTGGVFTDQITEFVARIPSPCVSKPFDTRQLRRMVEKRLLASTASKA